MNGQFLDILAQRRVNLHFISPAICENDFSASGEVMIILAPFDPWDWGSGPVWFFFSGDPYLWWGTLPGVICISVYQKIDGEYVLIAECVDPNVPWKVPPGVIPEDIVITAVTDDGGETPFSPPPRFVGSCVNISSASPAVGVPLDYAGCDPVTLQVTVTGSNPITYRWYHNSVLAHQGTSNSYTFPMAKNLAGLWSVTAGNTIAGCPADTEGNWDLVYVPLEIVTLFDEEGGCIGEPYLFTFGADGGTPIDCDHYDWTLTDGALPDGLALDLVSGEISGTPTVGGLFTFTVTATDDESDSISEEHSIVVIEFTADSPLLDGIENEVYSDSVSADPPGLTFSVVSGALPDGLVLEAGGNITGTPTTGGDYTFTVMAESADPLWSCEKEYTIKIWYDDNTFVTRWGSAGNNVAQSNVAINSGVALTPGVYKVVPNFIDYGSCQTWGFLGDSIKYPVYPHGAYQVTTFAGGPLGIVPNGQPQPWLSTVDGLLCLITGMTTVCAATAGPPPACAADVSLVIRTALAGTTVARFTLPASRVVRYSFPERPAVIYTDTDRQTFSGSLGAGYDLYRIGKPTP